MANGTLADLAASIEDESYKEIPTSTLTKFELDALKAQGVDVSKPTVRLLVKPPKTITPAKTEPVSVPQSQAKEEMTVAKLESPAQVEVKKEEEPKPEPVPEPEVKVSDEDAHEYLRCILGGKGFNKTYKLMGGQVSVEFRSRTAEESFILSTILRNLRVQMGMANYDIINNAFLGYQLLYTATQVRLADKVIEVEKPTSKDFDEIQALTHKLLSLIPLVIYKGILRELVAFEQLTAALDTKVNDPNFWGQIGG